MKKKTIILSALICATLCASAQKITTKNEVIDLGNVLFQSPSTATFELQNTGNSPLRITNVKTSCGCTTVSFPKETIAAGASFTVSATYDAQQLGHFFKDIALYSEGAQKPYYLSIRGVVVDEVVDFSGTYPFTIGDVSAEKNDIEFDDVNRGDHPVQKVHIKNNTTQPVSPVVMHLPDYLTAVVSPTTIRAGKEGLLTFWLDSQKLRDYGLTQTSVFLGMYPGDKVALNKEITVSAVLLPAFQEMSEIELANAPQMRMSAEELNISLKGKNKAKETITIENVGKSLLDISSLQMFTTGLKVKLTESRLDPGEKASLKVTVDARALKAARSKPRLIMITNDPMKPKVIIHINVTE